MSQLREFKESELIFNEQETKDILKFFFRGDHAVIDASEVSVELRSFAQAILIEGIDATYAMGWLELTFRTVARPGASVRKSIKKLARKGLAHWFKHRSNQSLQNAEIYETVRKAIASRFRNPMRVIIQAKASQPWHSIAIHYHQLQNQTTT